MEPAFGVLLGLSLVAASSVQNNCTCATNKWTVCAQDTAGNCTCTLVGSNHKVNCSTLTSKCLLMKAETMPLKEKHFWGNPSALLDYDGTYNPDCEDSGAFKARQCNQTNTCWCVNTAGVRRTDKGDQSLHCSELVGTSWIYIELKHKKSSRAFNVPDVASVLKQLLESRYKLLPKYIAVIQYHSPLTQIRLYQNGPRKSKGDVDIADVAYYFEKDIKNDSLFHSNSTLTISVKGDALEIEKLQIYYLDDKPPEFFVRHLAADVSGTLTITVLTAGFGITVLVMLRGLRRRKYKKAKIEEMGEIRASSLALP